MIHIFPHTPDMDTKTFNNHVARQLSISPAEVGRLTECLGRVMAEIGTGLDSVAIPGFGTFTSVKHDERVVTDPSTGSRTLMPPAIETGFITSVVLRKKLTR